jgi:hypothetical protein
MTDTDLRALMLVNVANAAANLSNEMLALGYGKSKERPLPGTFDTLQAALGNLNAVPAPTETDAERYVRLFRHRFVTGSIRDVCKQCGCDLRDPIHAGTF